MTHLPIWLWHNIVPVSALLIVLGYLCGAWRALPSRLRLRPRVALSKLHDALTWLDHRVIRARHHKIAESHLRAHQELSELVDELVGQVAVLEDEMRKHHEAICRAVRLCPGGDVGMLTTGCCI